MLDAQPWGLRSAVRLEPATGVEPITTDLQGRCSAGLSYTGELVDHLGIEPSKLQPCKGCLGSQPIALIGARVLATDQCCAVLALRVWCC